MHTDAKEKYLRKKEKSKSRFLTIEECTFEDHDSRWRKWRRGSRTVSQLAGLSSRVAPLVTLERNKKCHAENKNISAARGNEEETSILVVFGQVCGKS